MSSTSSWAAVKDAFSFRRNLKSIFSRPNDHFAVLDGFRGFSMTWVYIFHVYMVTSFIIGMDTTRHLINTTPFFFNWIWMGDLAVDVFFVVSGFLISGLLFREYEKTNSINLKTFYVRRLLRLTPIYWLLLFLYLLIPGAENRENIWANMIYVNNFLPMDKSAMQWTWTLAVEEQFYMIFPLFLLAIFFASQHKIKWLIGLLVLSSVIRFFLIYANQDLWTASFDEIFETSKDSKFHIYIDTLYVNLYSRFGSFICGILASYLYFFHRDQVASIFKSKWGTPIGLLASFAALFFCFLPVYQEGVNYSRLYQMFHIVFNRNIFAAGISTLILAGICRSEPIGKIVSMIFGNRFWIPVAQLSYSTYIFHIVVVGFVVFNLKANLEYYGIDMATVNFYWLLLAVPLSVPICFIISCILYVFVEKPFMNLRRGYRPALTGKGIEGENPVDTASSGETYPAKPATEASS